jgi:hypothetical protein
MLGWAPMNLLESLITQQVSASVATLSRTTDKIAEQLAAEILKDPEFRTRMRELVKRAFDHALASLDAEAPPAPPT